MYQAKIHWTSEEWKILLLLQLAKDMLVYCDPPYQGTTQYGAFAGFDHELFWDTMREWSKHNTVVVSEYKAPNDFKCVAEFSSRMGLTTENERPIRCEKLFMYNGI